MEADVLSMQQLAKEARKQILRMIYQAGSGHPGGSLSCVDILLYLYWKEIAITKENANSLNRDKLVLSKGHAAPALYAALASRGILTEEALMRLRKIDSMLQGHPNMNDTPGVDMSSGSLGQGISAAVGMALADKLRNSAHRTYVICGDGEFEEGQVYEALMAASHYRLNNLILFLDHNGLQIDGRIEDVLHPQPFREKLEAFGWRVLEIDGHAFEEIEEAVQHAKHALRVLRKEHIEAALYNVSTLKPFNRSRLQEISRQYDLLITMEEHTVIGGLYSVVMENLGEYKRVVPIAVDDCFGESGTPKELMKKYKIDAAELIRVIKAVW